MRDAMARREPARGAGLAGCTYDARISAAVRAVEGRGGGFRHGGRVGRGVAARVVVVVVVVVAAVLLPGGRRGRKTAPGV